MQKTQKTALGDKITQQDHNLKVKIYKYLLSLPFDVVPTSTEIAEKFQVDVKDVERVLGLLLERLYEYRSKHVNRVLLMLESKLLEKAMEGKLGAIELGLKIYNKLKETLEIRHNINVDTPLSQYNINIFTEQDKNLIDRINRALSSIPSLSDKEKEKVIDAEVVKEEGGDIKFPERQFVENLIKKDKKKKKKK